MSDTSFRHYSAQVRVDPDGKPNCIIYPYPNGSKKIRSLGEKKFWSEGDPTKAGLFGRDKFSSGSHKWVTITEGELDAISLFQVVRAPVVSIRSSSSCVSDVSVDRDWLMGFERILLCFDSDSAGREAARRVAALFEPSRVFQVKLDRHKDANGYVEAGEEVDLLNIWHNAKRYVPDTIVSSMAEFKKLLSEEPKHGVPYPFPTLTEKTYGIRTGEIVLITAPEGVGKTELCHTIEHGILRNTTANVGALYIEEPNQRHLEAITGIELGRPIHLPDSGVTFDQKVAALETLLAKDERLFLYRHFGSGDPDVFLDTTRYLVAGHECRYVILDHISMVVSGGSVKDERKILDYLSTKLEMMVTELDFSLIVVSHINDEGATRGSRAIAQTATIRIDLSRDVKANSPLCFVNISKNRYSSRTGPAGVLEFDPVSFTLKEVNDVCTF